jgi:hypothetical protein
MAWQNAGKAPEAANSVHDLTAEFPNFAVIRHFPSWRVWRRSGLEFAERKGMVTATVYAFLTKARRRGDLFRLQRPARNVGIRRTPPEACTRHADPI